MEKTLSCIEKTYSREEDKKVYRIMENMLGIGKKTKLEKLANSFHGLKHEIYPDKENSDIGSIDFAYKIYGNYLIKKEESEIKKIINNFYNKEDYIISVANHDYGFSIIIWNNFIKEIFEKSKKKSS
jgi:hypothetical protein